MKARTSLYMQLRIHPLRLIIVYVCLEERPRLLVTPKGGTTFGLDDDPP